jgi:hypothetical protein
MSAPVKIRHFKEHELAQAQRFMERGVLQGEWAFSVPLETETSRKVLERDPATPFWLRYSWMMKIDAVVRMPGKVALVEFDVRPRFSTLSQIQYYALLYEEQYNPGVPLELWLVYGRPSPDVLRQARRMGIHTFQEPVEVF